MCDRLVGPDLTHHNGAPAHTQAATKGGLDGTLPGAENAWGRWYQCGGIALHRVGLPQHPSRIAAATQAWAASGTHF